MPSVLLFDVMDTLVHEPYWKELPAFFGLTHHELVEQQHPTAWIDFERGLLAEETYLRQFFRDGRSVDGPGLRAHVAASYRWIDGMEALLDELSRGGRPVHALSNYPVWYELIEQRLVLSRFLRWTFVSCHTGVRKPEPEAFLGPARSLGLDPGECLLVDDRPGNVDAAVALGLDAVLFTDAAALRSELARRELL